MNSPLERVCALPVLGPVVAVPIIIVIVAGFYLYVAGKLIQRHGLFFGLGWTRQVWRAGLGH